MSVVPLNMFGGGLPGDMELLKQAKHELGLPFLIRPMVAVPGKNQRVLALRDRPTFLVDNVLVLDPGEGSVLRTAMSWALRQTDTHHLAMTADEMVVPLLRSVFGHQVREIIEGEEEEVAEAVPAPKRRREPLKQETELDAYVNAGWMTGADLLAR